MTEYRRITSSKGLDFLKIMDYRMMEGLVSVSCIDVERLAIDGLGAVRMQAYATRKAVDMTLDTGLATFWSRTKQELWVKGQDSGNVLNVRGIYTDCDKDSLIYDVNPTGPSCYDGMDSCFTLPKTEGDEYGRE